MNAMSMTITDSVVGWQSEGPELQTAVEAIHEASVPGNRDGEPKSGWLHL